MGLLSRKSDTHNHLSRASKRHSNLHTVTPVSGAAGRPAKPAAERPFGKLVWGSDTAPPQGAYKSIFDL